MKKTSTMIWNPEIQHFVLQKHNGLNKQKLKWNTACYNYTQSLDLSTNLRTQRVQTLESHFMLTVDVKSHFKLTVDVHAFSSPMSTKDTASTTLFAAVAEQAVAAAAGLHLAAAVGCCLLLIC